MEFKKTYFLKSDYGFVFSEHDHMEVREKSFFTFKDLIDSWETFDKYWMTVYVTVLIRLDNLFDWV